MRAKEDGKKKTERTTRSTQTTYQIPVVVVQITQTVHRIVPLV